MFQNWTACSISLDWPTHRTYITDFSVPIGPYLLPIYSNSSSWLKWPHMIVPSERTDPYKDYPMHCVLLNKPPQRSHLPQLTQQTYMPELRI